MTYKATLDYLYAQLPVFHNIGAKAYKPGLENTIKILNVLENPQNKFKSIHIAGTNGKGSVSHALSAILQSAGYKTGLYTSPHLIEFGERIRIDGKMIEKQYVVDFVENNKSVIEQIRPSFFEITMAMAFQYFADCKVDIAVIETGLGGRLDSTNIINPELSIITNISYDHTQFLGDTLEKIAFEKAGIIKENIPVVIGEWQKETFKVFESKAQENSSPMFYADDKLEFLKYENDKMLCSSKKYRNITLGLTGNYQLLNMATILKAVEILNSCSNIKVTEKALRAGIENVTKLTGLRGRWEKIFDNPTVIADTGHNVAGITFVANQLKQQQYNQLHIVFGVVNDKDITHILELLPQNAEYYFTQANINRALPATELKHQAAEKGLIGNVYNSVLEAFNAAKNNAKEDDFIFVGGSNFVVGEVLEFSV
jgi:folylpolyglutamate synthase/dihydrofolate synthase